jgi:death-on-curing family protein
MKLPDKNKILDAHEFVIQRYGGESGILYLEKLNTFVDSLNRFIRYTKPDIYSVAAWILYTIIQDHYFIDGNKRCAFMITITFLELNGCTPYQIANMNDLLFNLTMDIASQRFVEYDEVIEELRKLFKC